MVPLFYNLKILRLGNSISSCTFTFSKIQRIVVGDLSPSSHFSLQNQFLLHRPITTSETSANQHSFTVTYLINSCGLSPGDAVSASKRVKLQSQKRADSVLGLLRNRGGLSETQISKFVKLYPRVLLVYPEKTLLPKIEFFSCTGLSKKELARVLAYNPVLLAVSLENRIIPTYNFLRSMLSDKHVVFIFKNSPWIFLEGHCKNVVPNIGILRKLGMPQSCISMFLVHCTSTAMLKREKFGEVVDEVREMGFNLEKSASVFALRALGFKNSKLIWNRSHEVYRRWGWSEDDVRSAFRKHPQCMIMSEKKIMQVLDFLVNKMGWPSEMIVKNPTVLCLSLEKRIIPRSLVVTVLLSKGLINKKFGLSYVFFKVEKHFLERFVVRYLNEVPQLLSLYQGKVGIQDV